MAERGIFAHICQFVITQLGTTGMAKKSFGHHCYFAIADNVMFSQPLNSLPQESNDKLKRLWRSFHIFFGLQKPQDEKRSYRLLFQTDIEDEKHLSLFSSFTLLHQILKDVNLCFGAVCQSPGMDCLPGEEVRCEFGRHEGCDCEYIRSCFPRASQCTFFNATHITTCGF